MRELHLWCHLLAARHVHAGESGGGSGASEGSNSSVAAVVRDIMARLPADFDLELAQEKFPVSYHQSMNQVCTRSSLSVTAPL